MTDENYKDIIRLTMKRLIVLLALAAAVLVVRPASVKAQTTTLEPGVCTTVYGGGVVCGAKHEVVETGLGENLAMVGALSILASGVLVYLNRKSNKSVING